MASPASIPSRALDPSGEASANAHPSARPTGEAVAVTVRDDFLLELGEALGGQIALRPVDSLATALEHLSGARRAQILLIDSRDSADLRGDVEHAHAQAPQVPLVVFAPADSEKAVAGALKSSNVFAVLPIPVDPRKTAAIFDGALADASAKRGTARGADRSGDARTASRPPLIPDPAPATEAGKDESEPPSRKKVVSGAIAAVAVIAAAAIGLSLQHKTRSTAPAAASKPGAAIGAPAPGPAAAVAEATQTPLVEGTLDELLEKARLAMRERRYTEPASNCALLYYRSALKVDPRSGEARDGMSRLAGLLMSRFDDALSGGRYDEAAGAIADLKVASPADARLATLQGRLLQAEVSNAFAAGDIDRATALVRQAQQSGAVPASELAKWRAELSHDQSEARATHLADLFNQRIRDGRLVEPSADSAKYYLQQLKSFAPENPVAQRGSRDLIAACLLKAREAAIAGHSAEADQWVSEARAAGMTNADLSDYQREIAAARAKAATAESDRLAQLARDRIEDGHLTDPASDSADYYLTQLKSSFSSDPAVRSIALQLASSLIEHATTAARGGNIAQMNVDLSAARRWGADPALVQAVEQIVTGPAKPTEPARETGPAIPAGYVPRRIRYTAPEYPEAALDAHLSGSVTVEFTVDLRGQPRDVRVVESTPRGVFDYAATSAVSRWRFAPPVVNDVPTEIPTRTVIRFNVPN